ncbi:hypothetical protein F5H01DRAFT_352274 [Linnemannia elongata]|nr:hypothetical protein F5H01DRAFT_352274 [Linnemannia elongata]
MKFIATIAALATAATVASVELPPPGNFSSCDSYPKQLALTTFTLSPSPMCVGKQACYTATGTLNTGIVDGATLRISGRYLGRLFYNDNANLCDALIAGGHKNCTIPAGPVTLRICRNVRPNLVPNIRILFQVEAVNGDGGNLFCQKETNSAVLGC